MLLPAALTLVLSVVAWALVAPAHLAAAAATALAFTTAWFGWMYLCIVFGVVLFCLYAGYSRYGTLRLGGEDAEPEFTRGAWFALLFSAGMGIGLVFFGAAEPLLHYRSPPPGVAAGTPEAANAAMRYAFFHWGLHPWAIYTVVALAIAFYGAGGRMTLGATLGGLRGGQRFGRVVDVLALVATVFGVATSLGLGAMQINGGLATLFGVPSSLQAQVAIIGVTTLVFLASALSGLQRGVKWLSTANLALATALAALVLVLGPTRQVLDTFTSTLGAYLSDFVRMSLRLTPFRDSTWVGDWTVFYWAWWLSWSPFVGLFIARVSRGRTVREFVTGTLLVPSLAGFVWFSVFGGGALHFEVFANAGLSAAAAQDAATAVFRFYERLPLALLLSLATTVLVFVFFVTSADSATVVLATLASDGAEPRRRAKLAWGVLIALVAVSLLVAGGLKGIQTAAIVSALPFAIVIALICVSLHHGLAQAWRARAREEQQLRRRLLRDDGRPPA